MPAFNLFNQFAIDDLLRYGIALIVVASGIIAIGYSIWGGLLLITSGGNEEKVKPAVNHIRHAIIGIIVVMLVIFAAPVFARIGGLDFPDSLQPNSIFSTIREVTARIFGSSNLEVSGRNNFETPNRPLGNDFTNL